LTPFLASVLCDTGLELIELGIKTLYPELRKVVPLPEEEVLQEGLERGKKILERTIRKNPKR